MSIAMLKMTLLLLYLAVFAGPGPTAQGELEATPASTELERADLLYSEGTELYRRGDYGPAATRFEAALGEPGAAGELLPAQRVRILRALGNCSFRRGDSMAAVGWYSAALRHAPRDTALWSNVELARSEAGLPPADRGDLSSTLDFVLHAWRPEESRLMALIGGLLLLIAMLVEILRGGLVARFAVLGSTILALILALPWFVSLLPEVADPHMLLRASTVPVRSEPEGSMAVVAHLEPGSIVTLLDELGQWVRVEGPDDELGWIPKAAVFALDR